MLGNVLKILVLLFFMDDQHSSLKFTLLWLEDLSQENYNMTTHTHTCTHAHNISMVRRLQLIQ